MLGVTKNKNRRSGSIDGSIWCHSVPAFPGLSIEDGKQTEKFFLGILHLRLEIQNDNNVSAFHKRIKSILNYKAICF